MFKKIKYKIWRHLNKKFAQVNTSVPLEVKPFTPPKSSFKNVIAITGFGYTGSGALLDLLSEFKDVTVLSDADPDGSLRNKNYNSGTNEFNILRHAGGLFFLEQFFPSKNIFIQDAVIKMFIALVKEHYINNGSIFNSKFLELSKEFLDSIVDIKIKTPYGAEYQPHLPSVGLEGFDFTDINNPKNYLYSLKNISKDEYILRAKDYINKVLKTINSNEYLVLDQILSDTECDIEHYEKYFDNLKLIAVYRDPRDVFATAISKNVTWLPKNADDFIAWYKRFIYQYLNKKHPNYLLLRFENLVFNYDKAIKQICEFLNIDVKSHTAIKTAFDPNVSFSNVGLYKSLDMPDEIAKIEKELKEFLYDEKSNTNEPLVSICCISYNHEKFIKEAIESFWNQEYKNIEIIALDDGSKDNSVKVLKELQKKSPCPMTVIAQENSGNIPANFNKTLKRAKGKYISMIALDDFLSKNSVNRKVQLMEENSNIAFVVDSKMNLVDEFSNFKETYLTSLNGHTTINVDDAIEYEYHQQWTYYTQGSLFRSEVLKKINYYDEDMISDDDVLRLKLYSYLKKSNEIFYILEDASCNYRQHSSNVSNNLYKNCLMISQVFDRFFPDRIKSDEYKKRAEEIIKSISFNEFKKLKYFGNENKPAINEWFFYYYHKFKNPK